MKVETTKEVNQLPISDYDKKLLSALLVDVGEINHLCEDVNIYIDWQDYHNEYSPERTDPCPDYYGYYTIRCTKHPSEIIGVEMTINDLDVVLCTLCNFVEL